MNHPLVRNVEPHFERLQCRSEQCCHPCATAKENLGKRGGAGGVEALAQFISGSPKKSEWFNRVPSGIALGGVVAVKVAVAGCGSR
jgi:hypothetical protein